LTEGILHLTVISVWIMVIQLAFYLSIYEIGDREKTEFAYPVWAESSWTRYGITAWDISAARIFWQ